MHAILRRKRRPGIASIEFLRNCAVPCEMDKDGIAGVKRKPVDDGGPALK
jgi:hypothetical protein